MAPVTLDVLHSTGSAEFPPHRPRGARGPISAFSEVRTKMKPRIPINQGAAISAVMGGASGVVSSADTAGIGMPEGRKVVS